MHHYEGEEKSQRDHDNYKTYPHFMDVKVPGGRGLAMWKCNISRLLLPVKEKAVISGMRSSFPRTVFSGYLLTWHPCMGEQNSVLR